MSNNYDDVIKGIKYLDLNTCVAHYKCSRNEFLLKIILYKLRGTIHYHIYKRTNYSDKATLYALCEDKLLECIETFDPSYNTQFTTYYSTCLNNAVINYITASYERERELSLDYEYNSYENKDRDSQSTIKDKFVVVDSSYDDVETCALLEQLKGKLDENEYKYCMAVINEKHNLNQTEIAEELGLTLSAIPNIVARLRKKITKYKHSKKFLKSL